MSPTQGRAGWAAAVVAVMDSAAEQSCSSDSGHKSH